MWLAMVTLGPLADKDYDANKSWGLISELYINVPYVSSSQDTLQN